MAGFMLANNCAWSYLLFGGFKPEAIDSPAWVFGFAFLWPKILVTTGLAAVLITLAIRDWHGNVTRMLLLRLLDGHERPRVGDEHAA